MAHEALVFRQQHGLLHGGGNIGQRHPGQAPHFHVHAQGLQRRTAAVEQLRLRTAVGGLHLGRRQYRFSEDGASQQAAHGKDSTLHCATFTLAFGDSPNISGEYMASMRVAGRLKSPALFRRTVYSTLHVPFGTKA
ncbi:hypothetical protein D3C81_555990 [compost metagenome]